MECPGICSAYVQTCAGCLLSTLQSSNICSQPMCIQDLHAHLQPLLYFFVDAASAIDSQDPGWVLLLATRQQGAHSIVVSCLLVADACLSPFIMKGFCSSQGTWQQAPSLECCFTQHQADASHPPSMHVSIECACNHRASCRWASVPSTPCMPTHPACACASARSWCCPPTSARVLASSC